MTLFQDKLFIMRFNDGSATGQLKGIKKKDGAWLVCDLTADGNDVVTSTCVSMATFSLTGVSLDDLLFVELYLKGDEGNTLWKWYLNLDSTIRLELGTSSRLRVAQGEAGGTGSVIASNDSSLFESIFGIELAHAEGIENALTALPKAAAEYFIDVDRERFAQDVTVQAIDGFEAASHVEYLSLDKNPSGFFVEGSLRVGPVNFASFLPRITVMDSPKARIRF